VVLKTIFYIYPINKWVSFHTIGEYHIRELRKYFHVENVDENTLTIIMPIAQLASNSLFILHPYFYPMQVYERKLLALLGKPEKLIGVDVADSDHITEYAVHLTEYATALIVPSNFARNSYINSGVKTPVHVIPHGVEDNWINQPPSKPNTFKNIYSYKMKNNLKLIQTWVLHSPYRKGLDLAYEIFNRLISERKDVALALRTGTSIDIIDKPITDDKPQPSLSIPMIWMTEQQIMELMDICDIYMLTSRGGGFEHPPLQALARGEPAIGAKGGAWEDYMPDWSLIPSHKSDIVLKGNPIHDGYGVEIEIDKSVNALHNILDNLEDYKAKTREYANTHIKQNFTWTNIGKKLKDIITQYL
jgi:glycosyltransferase involved in cell wall biosynthesis